PIKLRYNANIRRFFRLCILHQAISVKIADVNIN
ncbi:hypothetical protein LTSEINV_5737, partial [Salmonella enterica subsp. enterica serovar Inverness str. R8-3668]